MRWPRSWDWDGVLRWFPCRLQSRKRRGRSRRVLCGHRYWRRRRWPRRRGWLAACWCGTRRGRRSVLREQLDKTPRITNETLRTSVPKEVGAERPRFVDVGAEVVICRVRPRRRGERALVLVKPDHASTTTNDAIQIAVRKKRVKTKRLGILNHPASPKIVRRTRLELKGRSAPKILEVLNQAIGQTH